MRDSVRADQAMVASEPLPAGARIGSPGDISFLIRVILRYRVWLGLFALAGVLTGILAYAVIPKKYAATAQIVIDFRRLAVIAPSEATFNYRMSDAAVQTQISILTSDAVLRRAVDKLNLTRDPDFVGGDGLLTRGLAAIGIIEDPASRPANELRDLAVEALRKALFVDRDALSYMITIRATLREAAKAARVVDAIAESYVDDQFFSRSEIAERAHEWFKERLRELQDLSGDALRAAVDFRAKNQIIISSGKYVDEQQLEDISLRLLGTQNRRVIAEARLQRVQNVLQKDDASGIVAGGGLSEELRNPVIVAQINRYNELNRRYAENLGRYGPEHEAVKRTQSEMAEVQRSIDSEFRRVAEALRSEAEISRSEEAALLGVLNEFGKRATATQRSRVELTLLENAAESYTKLRDFFVSQYSASTQQETYPINETRILNKASVPMTPASPLFRRFVIGGLSVGLAVGLVVVFGMQAFGRRLRTRAQLEAVTRRRCLGYFPEIGGAGLPKWMLRLGAQELERDQMVRELLNTVLFNLCRIRDASRRNVIGVVGPVPGHGASSLSTALAMAAARSGEKVLLVDADVALRSVSARVLGKTQTAPTPALQALAETFGGNGPVPMATSGVVRHPSIDGLFVLPVPEDAEGAYLHESRLSGQSMIALMAEARELFDLVIVDLPPLAPLTKARRAAAAIDGFALVVGWRGFDAQDLHDLLNANSDVSERLIGGIYNRISLDDAEEIEDAALVNTIGILGNPRRRLLAELRRALADLHIEAAAKRAVRGFKRLGATVSRSKS